MALQVWLPLTGSTTQQGLSSITMSGSPNSWVDGKLGKCAHFTGSTTNVIYNNTTDFNFTDNFSYCCWLKQNFTSGAQYAFTVGRADAGGYGYGIAIASATQITTIFGTRRVAVACAANEWHHVAVTIGDGKVKSYVDGSLVNTSDVATVPTYSDGNGLGLGCFHYSGNIYPYYGDLQDFRIYDHCLSALEVKQISQALLLHYPMTGGGRGGENIITDTSPNEVQYTYPASGSSDRFFKTSTIVPSASQYILSFWAKSTHAGDKVRAHWYSPNTTTKSETNQGETTVATDGRIDFTLSDKWEKYWCIWTQSSTTAVKHFIFPRMYNQAAGQACGTGTVSIKCVKLEEGNVPTPWMPNSADTAYISMGYNDSTEYDVSGYLHNATCTNTSYSSDAARYPVSTVFNKTAYLDVSALTIDMTQVTFAAWFKITSAQTWSRIFDFGSAEGGGYCFGLATGNNGTTLVVYGRRGSSGASLPDKTIQTISLNTWYHAVITLSGTTCKCYVNGTLVISYEITSAYPNSVAFALRYLGKSVFSADKLFDGNISDFRIYATCLDQEDIQKLYNTSASLANNGTLLGYELVET